MPKATILLIENNVTTRNLLREALANADFIVVEAETGIQALRILDEQAPDLIIQDLHLPDVDGVELNERIKERKNYKEIPTIALLGFLTKSDEIPAIISGFSTYLIKPIDTTRLLELVQMFLPQHRSPKKIVVERTRVLVADDDPPQLKLLSVNLKHAGFDVDTAVNGNDAWKQFVDNPPDALVSDILMPGLDGFELCIKVRTNPKFAHIPVILISSQYLEKADRNLAKKIGANAFVMRSDDLKTIINTLITNLKDTPPPVSISGTTFKKEHKHRLIRQLEKQVRYSTSLAQRSALQTAQLSLLKGLADALTTSKTINGILQNTLAIALDAAGISKGLLYLTDANDNLTLKQVVGYSAADQFKLEKFFGQENLFQRALESSTVLQIPSNAFTAIETEQFLLNAEIKSAVFIPLISAGSTVGLLVLGSNLFDVSDRDFFAFAHTLGKQMAQTIELAKMFEHLLRSEARYRTLMDKANCGIMLCNREGTIIEVNKEMTALFGADREQIIGRNYESFMIPTDREYVNLMVQKLRIEKNVGPIEGRIKRVDGSMRDIEYSLATLRIGGEKVIFAIINDITERNRLHSQVELSDKLATIGTLATGIVHEINNPLGWLSENLTFIHDYIKTLGNNLEELLDRINTVDKNEKLYLLHEFSSDLAQQLKNLNEMANESITGAMQIREIVRNLKGFSRIDEESVSNAADIHEVLDSAIKLAHHEFKYNAKLEKNYDTQIPLARLHANKLRQVFLNLIVNAAQALPKDKFRDNRILISTRLVNQFMHVEIKDTGLGIPADVLPKIFDPFFTTKPAGIGTGLGLSICQDIIRHLGGDIKVETELNKGSTFTVMFPLQVETIHLSEVPPHEIEKRKDVHVLVVDDEPSLLKTLQHILETKYEVTTALGGRQALDLLTEQNFLFNVLIIDLNMPGFGGVDLYRLIAEKHPGLEQNVIFISGELDAIQHENFLTDIKNPCIEKPFTREELLRTVEKLIATTALTH